MLYIHLLAHFINLIFLLLPPFVPPSHPLDLGHGSSWQTCPTPVCPWIACGNSCGCCTRDRSKWSTWTLCLVWKLAVLISMVSSNSDDKNKNIIMMIIIVLIVVNLDFLPCVEACRVHLHGQ